MISLLCPTRKRPKELTRMVESARATANGAVETVLYIDLDDPVSVDIANSLGVKYKFGPRITLSQCWNECAAMATGDIFCQANDDIVFRTQDWNLHVEEAFAAVEDKILMVHCDNKAVQSTEFGTHPFVHRRWVEVLGYFTPPYFSSDYGDTWINALANAIGRRRYLPDVIEHMHYIYGKAQVDETTSQRMERHQQDDPGGLYDRLAHERETHAALLRSAMRTA